MKVGVIQSNYVPWRGYFDFIASVDLFVLYDDVAYSKGTYRNRNQLKCADGLRWMTVPVKSHLALAIDEVQVDASRPEWAAAHERLLRESLESAPCFDDALRVWRSGVAGRPRRLSELNAGLIRAVCEYLSVETPIEDSRKFGAVGRSTGRLVDLLQKVGAAAYLSGPSARDYLDTYLFRDAGISLEYKTYDYEPYPQQFGPFAGAVSVLDLIANCGTESRRFLRSRSPNEVVC